MTATSTALLSCVTKFTTSPQTVIQSSTITSYYTSLTTSYYYSLSSGTVVQSVSRLRRDINFFDRGLADPFAGDWVDLPEAPAAPTAAPLLKRDDPAAYDPNGNPYCTDVVTRYIFPNCHSCVSYTGARCTYVTAPWVEPCGGYCYSTSAAGYYYSTISARDAFTSAGVYTTRLATSSIYTSTVIASVIPTTRVVPGATIYTSIAVPTATSCSAIGGSSKLSKGATAGVAVGAVVGAGIIAAILFLFFMMKKKKQQQQNRESTMTATTYDPTFVSSPHDSWKPELHQHPGFVASPPLAYHGRAEL
ncbi:hypothetical protein T439DRAFT_326050 [Meredithblackwellia eburnea MCA 4105]